MEIEKFYNRYGKSLSDFEGMSLPDATLLVKIDNRLICEEYDYNIGSLRKEHAESLELLNLDQIIIYDRVISAVGNKSGGLFFRLWPRRYWKDIFVQDYLGEIEI